MRSAVLFLIVAFLAVGGWYSQERIFFPSQSSVPQGTHNVNAGNVMLKGYDPVAYFGTNGSPKQGDPAFSARHDGVVYHFASAENISRFKQNPERYVPQYGGFCSYGVRMGQKLDIDPNAFRIVDERLFLQLDLGARLTWMKDEAENIVIADDIWQKLHDQETGIQ